MCRWFHNDVFRICAYVVASIALGAAISPYLYNLGMGIAEVTRNKDTNSVITWLGDAAWRSSDNFPRFFDRALMLAAVILLPFLLMWLRLGRKRGVDEPWTLGVPDATSALRGQRVSWGARGLGMGVVGFLVAAGLLLLSGVMLVNAGFFMWRDAEVSARGAVNPAVVAIDWARAVRKSLTAAAVVSILEEILFRGILLGIFLRVMRPWAAVTALSLLFAMVHFLEPPPGVKVPDPEALDAGFVLLGQILSRFLEPYELLARLAGLFVVGVILAVARLRTGSLWLPIGLHAGWVFAYQVFKSATWSVPDLPEASRWLVGTSLLEGMVPLTISLVTGILALSMTRSTDSLSRHG
ncbi:MAG: hypothetical protein RLZ97_774 [Verrucomicrobiota bacterium]